MKKGKIVKDELEDFQLQCTHKLIHPEYEWFANKVDGNTNKKEDRSYGDEQRLAKRGSKPKQIYSPSDTHWSLLGLTYCNG